MSGIKLVFGGATVGPGTDDRGFHDSAAIKELFDTLEAGGIKNVDTAQLYGEGESETYLGDNGVASRFIVDTKHVGGVVPGASTKDKVIERGQESLRKLQTKQVDVFYIHMPDRSANLADTLAGIQALYEAGSFKRFGLSNFFAKEVEEVYNLCKEKGYVLPTVYQGNYNPVARTQETVLFPTLRKLGISFYAYSPLAGGFLTKTKAGIEAGEGRFDKSSLIGQMYSGLYGKSELLESLAQWEETAKEEGCSRADLAYRWVRFNSPLKPEFGDAMIVGASNLKQLKQTIEGSNAGPLSAKAVERINAIWELVKDVAPLDNINSGPVGEQLLKGSTASTFLPPKENA